LPTHLTDDHTQAMPNHFVVRPDSDEQVSAFFRRLTAMHTMRRHAHYHTGGMGHLIQGRFKSFPVESDEHLLTVLRYVEWNPVRTGLVERAELWRGSSAWVRRQKPSAMPRWLARPTEPALPRQWLAWVNQPQTDAELKALRDCIRRSCPFGDESWASNRAVRLNLESTRRPRGRPKKES
jgi:putative transposase